LQLQGKSTDEKEKAWQVQDTEEENRSADTENTAENLAMGRLSSCMDDATKLVQRLHREDVKSVLQAQQQASTERNRAVAKLQQRLEARLKFKNQELVRTGASSTEIHVALANIRKDYEKRQHDSEKKRVAYRDQMTQNMGSRRALTERGMIKLQQALVAAVKIAQERLQKQQVSQQGQLVDQQNKRRLARVEELDRANASKTDKQVCVSLYFCVPASSSSYVAHPQIALAELDEQDAGEQEMLAQRLAVQERQTYTQLNWRARQGLKDLDRLHSAYRDSMDSQQVEAQREMELNLELLHERQEARRAAKETDLRACGFTKDEIQVTTLSVCNYASKQRQKTTTKGVS
jgi:hypothetical protein